jgi:uroporphyrinogen-III synthase
LNTVRLLLTRPEPDVQRTAAALRALGHEVVVAPMLRIEPIADASFGTGARAALIMTSANAARAIAVHPRVQELLALTVFAVGRRTADAARIVGFTDVHSADADAAALARLTIEQIGRANAPLLYLAGEDRTGEIERALATHGLKVQTVVIYRAVAAPELAADITSALRSNVLDAALHFSQRSAQALVAAARAAGVLDNVLKMRHYCLSTAVAAVLEGVQAERIEVADLPDEQTLVARVGKLRK